MLEKLITNLKKSLPEPLRKKLGASEEEEVSEEEESAEERDSAEEAPASEEDKKKKQMSMIIRVVVILILGYLTVDEFVLKKPAEPTVDELLKAAPKKKRVSKKVEPPQEKKEESPITTQEPPKEEVAQSEAAPIENVNVLEKTEETQAPPAQEEVVESKPVETSVDQKLDELVQQPGIGQAEEIKVPSAEVEKKEESMASKIVDDNVTETPPPQYDQVGRGLVYNCKDKYWACVDKPSYVTCNKNMKWNKSKGNASECVIQAIYSSDDDCAKVQKYNVSTSQTTEFCQN